MRYLFEDQNYKGFLQKTHWHSRAQSEKLVIFSLRITKFSVKELNLEIIIVTLWRYKTWQHNRYNHTHVKQKTSQEIWQHNRYNHTHVKQKTSQETEKSLQKFPEPTKKSKVIYIDNSLENGKIL